MPPHSIPQGLIVELSRAKVLPGASDEADRWMTMLDERVDECVATLDEGGADLQSSTHQIDLDHQSHAARTKAPGWVEAEPQVLMLPEPVREAVLGWALRPGDE